MAAPQNYVSVSRRPPDVEDYIDMLRRYRSWVIGPTFAGLVVSVVVAFLWPNMYQCTAAMQIKPSSVTNELLPGVMTNQIQQRLHQLDLEILGRDNLIQLIKDPKLNLYEKEREHYTVEDVAEFTFRKALHIRPIEVGGNNGAQAFRIYFDYPDRNKARAVVLALISLYGSKNIQLQSETVQNQQNLFEDLVKSARDRLATAQANLGNFTSQNQGRLPENFDANAMEVQGLNNEISANNEKIASETQNQTLLEANLMNNKNMQTQTEENLNVVVNSSTQEVKNSNLVNIEREINTKRATCAALDGKYQEDFPSVKACHEELKSLEDSKVRIAQSETPAAPSGPASSTMKNANAAQALAQLKNEEMSIRAKINSSVQRVAYLNKQGLDLERRLKIAQDKINASPAIIQQYNALQQEVRIAQEDYTKANASQNNSATEKSVNEHQAGEQLNILENPVLPETPTSPVRGAIIGIGTLVGLVLGVGLAGAKEVKDTSLKNLKDVRAYTNLPVLSSIPLLENALLVRRKRRLAWLAWSSAIVVGSVMMSGALYYYYFLSNQVS